MRKRVRPQLRYAGTNVSGHDQEPSEESHLVSRSLSRPDLIPPICETTRCGWWGSHSPNYVRPQQRNNRVSPNHFSYFPRHRRPQEFGG
jgi:hypothetical protein